MAGIALGPAELWIAFSNASLCVLSLSPHPFYLMLVSRVLYDRLFGGQALFNWIRIVCTAGSVVLPPISNVEGSAYMVCGFRTYLAFLPSRTHTDLDTLASGHIGIAGLHANQTLRFVAEVVGRLNGVTGTPVIASENLLYTNAQSYLFGSCSASYAATQYRHMLTVDSKLGETGAPHDQ